MTVDPCAELARLRAIRTAVITGESETSIKHGDDAVEFGKADIVELDREIVRLERECALSLGQTPQPRRYAKGMRFRPHC